MADLTTLEKVRLEIFGNDPAIEADEILSALITSSSAWVESQIGRTFAAPASVTETRNGDGTSRMLLNKSPVASVTSVTVDGVTVPARATVDGTGWVYSEGGVDVVGSVFTEGVQNVVFVYSAGVAVPADLEQAVIEHVAFKFRRRNSLGLNATTQGGESVSFDDAAVMAGIRDVIDNYRGMVFA